MCDEQYIEYLNKVTQRNLHDKMKFLNLYPHLSQTGEMSQQQNEQEWMRMMNLLKESILQQHPEY